MKKFMARPTDYREEFCDKAVDLGERGKSRAQIARDLGVTRQTLANWEQAHPEFLDAMTQARELALAWWEDQGQEGIWSEAGGRTLNANAYRLQVTNRFPDDWRDKQEHAHEGGLIVQITRFSDDQK